MGYHLAILADKLLATGGKRDAHCGLARDQHRKIKLVWAETEQEHTARIGAGTLTETDA